MKLRRLTKQRNQPTYPTDQLPTLNPLTVLMAACVANILCNGTSNCPEQMARELKAEIAGKAL